MLKLEKVERVKMEDAKQEKNKSRRKLNAN